MGVFIYSRAVFSALITLGILFAVTWMAGSKEAVSAPLDIGHAKTVVNKVFGNTLSKSINQGDRVFQNQRVRTGRDSSTDIRFLDKSKLFIGEQSDLRLTRVIYDPKKSKVTGSLQMVKGIMRFASTGSVKTDLKVKTPHALLGIRGTVFDVLSSNSGTELAVHEGSVQIESAAGSARVEAGQVYRVSSNRVAGFSAGVSRQMKSAVSHMLAAVGETGLEKSASTAKPQSEPAPKQNAVSKPTENQIAALPSLMSAEESRVLKGKDLENILLLDLSFGRVMIEMFPGIAPLHVKRIKELVRRKFYDGNKFHNVVAGFAAETGDPTGTGRGGSGRKLKAELSSTRFVRGVVGMKRDRDQLDTADSQFFILLGSAKHLEGKYTAWGKVVYGMSLMDRLRKGGPPSNPDQIKSLRVAADMVGGK